MASWQSVLTVIDRVEAWIVLLPLPLQIVLLLVVLVPLCWFVAKVLDPVVDWLLVQVRRYTAGSAGMRFGRSPLTSSRARSDDGAQSDRAQPDRAQSDRAQPDRADGR